MQNNLGKTLTYSDLVTDFAMGGVDEGDGIINLGAMIDGGTNFKLMYNILERLGVNDTTSLSSSSYDAEIGDPMFGYNNSTSYRLVKNSNSTFLDHNIVIDSGIFRTIPNTNSNNLVPTPVLTPLFCEGSELTKRWEVGDTIYYFVPSTTSSSMTGWIALGVKSNCWSQDNLDRWIIGKRISINKSFNYIFKAVNTRSQGVSFNPNYVWYYYIYSNSGSYASTTQVLMNNFTFDSYQNANASDKKPPVTKNSVYNRLSGNFYDILRGLKTYDYFDQTANNRNCTCFYCPYRGTGIGGSGTGTINLSVAGNLHAAPHVYLNGRDTVGWWDGINRPFGIYRHIASLNLSNIYNKLGLSIVPNLILYPGVIQSGYGESMLNFYLTSGAINDLNTKIGTSTTDIATINQYNQFIISQSTGRIMYIIPSYSLPTQMSVNINTPKSAIPYWNCPASASPSKLSTLGKLSPGNSYIIECWNDMFLNGVPKRTCAKMYTYSTLTGECNNVSDTISCNYIAT